MSTKPPELIIETNLSYAWARAFLYAMDQAKGNLQPLIVSVNGFTDSVPAEDLHIRQALAVTLRNNGKYTSSQSALTIFPYKHWIRTGQPPRQELRDWYLNKFLPRLRARDSQNRKGTYFERMIAFQGVKSKSDSNEIIIKNQLDHIIEIWHRHFENSKRPRQSALQVACFDPAKDLTGSALSGFPCLQQMSFTYDNDNGLAVSGYYPTQYIFDRAYGNYLGLCHLGHFMAHEMGLKLVRMNCFIAHPDIGDITKGKLRPLKELVEEILQRHITN